MLDHAWLVLCTGTGPAVHVSSMTASSGAMVEEESAPSSYMQNAARIEFVQQNRQSDDKKTGPSSAKSSDRLETPVVAGTRPE